MQFTINQLRIVRLMIGPKNLDRPRRLHGYSIASQLGLEKRQIYRDLEYMERTGWLVSETERIDRNVSMREPRRLYQITEAGMREGGAVLARLQGAST